MARDGMISVTTAAKRLRKNYRTMLDMVLRGELQGDQADNGRWSVLEADVERLERQAAASHAVEVGYSPALAERVRPLYEALKRCHQLGVSEAAARMEREMHVSTIRGDAAELEQAGDTQAAVDFREAADQLERAEYLYDAEAGRWTMRVAEGEGYLVPAPKQPA
jgi:hypothetical protein